MKERLKSLVPKSAFVRGVSVLVGGTAGAQALMILASPLLTRLYTPEDFGLLAVYGGLLALFTVVASLRYELAIPLPENHTEAANLVVLSLLIVLMMTSVSGLMVWLAGKQIAYALDSPTLAMYFWLLPVGVFFSGIYKVFNYWGVRTKAFGDIARTRVSQTLTTLAIQILGFKLGGMALIVGQASGQGVGSFRLARNAFTYQEFKTCSLQGCLAAAKRYKQFPLYSTGSGLFNTAGTQLPPLLFAALFSASSAGLYALASRILKLPMTVLGGAIGQVYFSNLAEAQRKSKLPALVERGFLSLLKLSMPVAAVFMIVAPDLFSFVFGESWRLSGEVARWMTPWLVFQFIGSPLSAVYFVAEKEKMGLIFQVAMFSFRVVSVWVGYHYFEFVGTLIIFSTISAISYLFYIFSVLVIARARFRWCTFLFIKEVTLVLISITPSLYFYHTNSDVWMYFCLFIFLLLFYVPRFRLIYR
ncbi:lipopolysaccharide biosynthesis protein [Marinobacter salicampi]|uniref:lipopolysaccharide biosynthesis protein n=1 Tax=Marinobacter salicampi TaxID=435907 RepID=UPI0014089917|nr:oligosaccharide flippase family protein [Marinobacter salicampi]